jgi:hypothetical protein
MPSSAQGFKFALAAKLHQTTLVRSMDLDKHTTHAWLPAHSKRGCNWVHLLILTGSHLPRLPSKASFEVVPCLAIERHVLYNPASSPSTITCPRPQVSGPPTCPALRPFAQVFFSFVPL